MNDNNYVLADISNEDINTITDLEKDISSKTNKKIVLIAYEENNEAKK